MSRKLIVANWKSYIASRKEAEALFYSVAGTYAKLPVRSRPELVFCPPFPYLMTLAALRLRSGQASLGAQDVFWESAGAYTGEVTPAMLKDVGISHVIIGHSERRKYLGETDEMVNKKVLAALKAKLNVILCVGEWTKPKGAEDEKAALAYVKTQLEKDIAGVAPSDVKLITIAYEPVWAIGTGVPDTPREALEVILFIRRLLAKQYGDAVAKKTRVLYGGSVNAENVTSFVCQKGVDGALVGGASTKVEEFMNILKNLTLLSEKEKD